MTSKPASERQYAYLATLLAERDPAVTLAGTGLADNDAFLAALRGAGATSNQVSAIIEATMKLPKVPAASAPVRRNNYGAACATCGVYVEAGAGTIARKASGKGWDTFHIGACPAPAAQAVTVEAGVYVGPTGDLVKVQANRQTGRLYALIAGMPTGEGKIDWQYIGAKGLNLITADWHRITADEARTIGLVTHHCMFCGLELTDEREGRSVEVGYGPSVPANNNLPWG
jgi:hypothetical protein